MASDPYHEEREARWRSGLIANANALESCARRLREAAADPDCARAKELADLAAHLARETARLVQEQSVENPPRRADS
jgi:hypothetical protein